MLQIIVISHPGDTRENPSPMPGDFITYLTVPHSNSASFNFAVDSSLSFGEKLFSHRLV